MSHAFTLQPNLILLNKYGYINLNTEQLNAAKTNKPKLTIEADAIWTTERREKTEKGFRGIVKKYKIANHYETLLYICIVESDLADKQFQYAFDAYEDNKLTKELAHFLLLNKQDAKHKPNRIAISTATETIKLTNSKLIKWIGELTNNALEQGRVSISDLNETILSFVSDEQGRIGPNLQPLNYNVIQSASQQTIRKPGRRERNKFLSVFLKKILVFLNHETTLKANEGVKYSDNQLNFLFDVAELFGWLSIDEFSSEPKDYFHTLLNNYDKL